MNLYLLVSATWTASCTMTGISAVDTEAISGTVSFSQEVRTDSNKQQRALYPLLKMYEQTQTNYDSFYLPQTKLWKSNVSNDTPVLDFW